MSTFVFKISGTIFVRRNVLIVIVMRCRALISSSKSAKYDKWLGG